MRFALVAVPLFILPVAAPASDRGSESQRLLQFVDRAFDDVVALSPESLTSLGDKKDYDKLNDYTEASAQKSQALLDTRLAQLRRDFDYARLDQASQLSYRLFEDSVAQSRLRTRWANHFYQLSNTSSPTGEIPSFLINMHRVDSPDDARAYVARLRDVERVMGEIATRMRAQAAKGIVAPKFVFAPVADDARKIVSGAPFDEGADSVLFADFRQKVDALAAPDEEKQRLIAEARAALAGPLRRGYEVILAALDELAAKATDNQGVWALPDGAAFYADQLRYHTTTTLTPEQIHELGLNEVARIQREMERIKAQVAFKGTLQEFFAHVKDGERFHYPNTNEGKQAYLRDAGRYVSAALADAPRYFHRLPVAKLEVRAVEPWREATASTGFYSGPAPDGSRPGIYYVNLSDMREVLKPQIEALSYHEGAPGHHFQIALAREMKDVPKFRRFGHYGAYIEGWGLYAEKLAKEMGFYEDEYAEFGRLSFEIMRAARLVVDSGIHAKRWSREQAIEYLERNTLLSDRDIVKQVERYFVWPGQATGYKIGELKILELRSRAERELGAAFDLRDFHEVVLGYGALPLDILAERVDAYIAATRPKTP